MSMCVWVFVFRWRFYAYLYPLQTPWQTTMAKQKASAIFYCRAATLSSSNAKIVGHGWCMQAGGGGGEIQTFITFIPLACVASASPDCHRLDKLDTNLYNARLNWALHNFEFYSWNWNIIGSFVPVICNKNISRGVYGCTGGGDM